MKTIKGLFLLTLVALVSSCASIVNGTNQSVSVNNGDVYGARCTLSNDKGTWYIAQTPGSAVIHRAYGDLKVECKKDHYIPGIKTVASHTKGMAFGNAVFGGIIGAGVDVANGSAYDYPTDIYVPMKTKA